MARKPCPTCGSPTFEGCCCMDPFFPTPEESRQQMKMTCEYCSVEYRLTDLPHECGGTLAAKVTATTIGKLEAAIEVLQARCDLFEAMRERERIALRAAIHQWGVSLYALEGAHGMVLLDFLAENDETATRLTKSGIPKQS